VETDDCTLTDSEGDAFLELVAACSKQCASVREFQSLVCTFVNPLLPHRSSIAVLGSMSFDHLAIHHVIGVDCPDRFVNTIPRYSKLADRPTVAKWLATREPVVVDPVRDKRFLSALERREIAACGQGRWATYGQIDLPSRMASYFSFAGVHALVNDRRAKFALQLMTPHLHAALVSIPTLGMSNPKLARLTRLELELLVMLSAGRSVAEIAAARARSPSTIRNQTEALCRKLRVSTRAEAVALLAREPR
jgi:DNA-binding CsgD family transcriptional regulator